MERNDIENFSFLQLFSATEKVIVDNLKDVKIFLYCIFGYEIFAITIGFVFDNEVISKSTVTAVIIYYAIIFVPYLAYIRKIRTNYSVIESRKKDIEVGINVLHLLGFVLLLAIMSFVFMVVLVILFAVLSGGAEVPPYNFEIALIIFFTIVAVYANGVYFELFIKNQTLGPAINNAFKNINRSSNNIFLKIVGMLSIYLGIYFFVYSIITNNNDSLFFGIIGSLIVVSASIFTFTFCYLAYMSSIDENNSEHKLKVLENAQIEEIFEEVKIEALEKINIIEHEPLPKEIVLQEVQQSIRKSRIDRRDKLNKVKRTNRTKN